MQPSVPILLLIRTVATTVASLVQALSLLLLARSAGPASYGEFGVLLSVGYICGSLLGFGFSIQALRIGSNSNGRQVFSTMLRIRLSTSLLVGIMILGIGAFSGDVAPVEITLAAVAFIFSELITELAQAGLSGQSKQIRASIFIVSQRALVLTVVLVSLLVNARPWIPATLAFIVSSIIASVSCRSLLTWRGVRVLPLLSNSRGYWVSSLTSSLTQLDVPTARIFGGDIASGILAAGSRLGTPLNLVTNAMLNVFVPTLVKSGPLERDRLFRRMRAYALVYAFALVAASPLVVWVLIQILGADFSYGWPVYVAICLGAAMSGVSQTYQSLLYTEGRPARAALFVATGTAISLASLAIGAYLMGVEGLALGPLIGQAAILLMFHVDWMRRPQAHS